MKNDFLNIILKDKKEEVEKLKTLEPENTLRDKAMVLHQKRPFFEKLKNPDGTNPNAAYYDVLYQGRNVTLVSKRIKTKYISNGGLEFQSEDKFYFIHNGQWSELSGINGYYELFIAQKVAIRNFVKSQKIKVRKQNERDMIAIASFCNTLE